MNSPKYNFVLSFDDTNINYTKNGSGPPLIFVRGWISDLNVFWSFLEFRRFFSTLGNHFTVIVYDARGNGRSSRNVRDLSWDAHVKDLEAIVKQEGFEDLVLWGSTFGSPIAVKYAIKHPDKVKKLILDGAYADGKKLVGKLRRYILLLCLRFFPEMAFLLLAYATDPDAQQAVDYRKPDSVSSMITQKDAFQLYKNAFSVNIERDLRKIPQDTLILHKTHSKSVKLEHGEHVASIVKNSQLIKLDGTAHNLWSGDPRRAIHEIVRFASSRQSEFPEPSIQTKKESYLLRAILYADVANFTEKMRINQESALKEVRTQMESLYDLAEIYNGYVRSEAGDSALVEFPSTLEAFECAVQFQSNRLMSHDGNGVYPQNTCRIGLHLGDIIYYQDTIYGLSVNVAQRISALSSPGGITMSSVFYNTLPSKKTNDYIFMGAKSLKGVSKKMGVYSFQANSKNEQIINLL